VGSYNKLKQYLSHQLHHAVLLVIPSQSYGPFHFF